MKYEEQLDQFARQIEIYVVEVSSLEFKNGDLSKKLTHSRERHDAEIKKIKRVKNEQISRLSKELEELKQREVDLAELRDKSRVDLEKEFVDVKLENEVIIIIIRVSFRGGGGGAGGLCALLVILRF